MDTGPQARKAARRHRFEASRERASAGGGRSVDVKAEKGRDRAQQKGLISRNFAEPSDGLEPSTPCGENSRDGCFHPAPVAAARRRGTYS